MNADIQRLRQTEAWIAAVRLAAVPWAVLEVGVLSSGYPAGYQRWAWGVTAVLAAGAGFIFWSSRRELPAHRQASLGLLALAFDTLIVAAYVLVYSFEVGTPSRQLLFVPVIEAAVRYGIAGVAVVPLAVGPTLALAEWWRSEHFQPLEYNADNVTFPVGLQLVVGLIVGRLTNRLRDETSLAEARAAEAERLRDELRRRADVLEAADRCGRALSSSLDLERALGAFSAELGEVVRFERMAIALVEDGSAGIVATAGAGSETVWPRGTVIAVSETVLEEIQEGQQPVYSEHLAETRDGEDAAFVELGLRCRVAAPLFGAAGPIGALLLLRAAPASFSADEIELVGLLGRLAGTAVENIRAYETERRTADELRKLSQLRADFVSLVSHELRSPMASVIGAARTLQQRWDELSAAQRESFLALIGDSTSRLADLIADVLDTSRIEAGTFSYSFSDVDVGELVAESVQAAQFGQDRVRVRAEVAGPLPFVRGDRERLRQVLVNLIDNAVKYTTPGDEVEVSAYQQDGRLAVDVSDHGPGIAPEHHELVFQKFGRANASGKVTQGTGLGLFIARSIAEAHGGSLELRSGEDEGSTFSLALPVETGAGSKPAPV